MLWAIDSDCIVANFAAYEVDDEVLSNLREYALANSLFWVGHLFLTLEASADLRTRPLPKVTRVNNQPAAMPWM